MFGIVRIGVVSIWIGLWLGPALAEKPAQEVAELEDEIHARINDARESHGVAPLDANPALAEVARNHSRFMAETGEMTHVGRRDGQVWDRLDRAGISYRVTAENVFTATNMPEPAEAAVSGWMKSEGHRENILNEEVTESGVGVSWRGDTVYITQVFRRPKQTD